MLNILVKNKKTTDKQSYKFKNNIIIIGRSRQCDVVLDSDTISRKHAALYVQKDGIFVEDLESGNGTFINQNKITPKQKEALKQNDVIRIEDFEIFWESEKPLPSVNPDSPMESTDPDILEIKMIKKVIGAMGSQEKPCLVMVSEPFQNQKIALDDPDKTYTIGRDESCDLVIDSSVVSRKHAEIFTKWGAFVIKDLQSKNGTFVNDQPIGMEVTLKDNDEVLLGTLKAVFQNPQQFQFKDIESSLKDEQKKKEKPSPVAEKTQESENEKPEQDKPDQTKDKEQNPSSKSPVKDKEKPPEENKKPQTQDAKAQKEHQKNEDPKDDDDQILEDLADPSEDEVKETPKKGFSKMEWILLGFGGLVFLTVVLALVFLFL